MKRFITLGLGLAALLSALPSIGQGFGYVFKYRWPAAIGPLRSLQFAPDGKWFLATAGEQAAVFDLGADGLPKERGKVILGGEIRAAAIAPDGKAIALVDARGVLSLVDGATLQPTASVLKAHTGWASAVTFTDDGSYVVTGGKDGRVRVWTNRGEPFTDLSGGYRHKGEIVTLAAVPSARRVVSVGVDRQLILWELDTQQAIRASKIDYDIRAGVLGADGKTLALGLQLLSGNRFRSASPLSLASSIRADDRLRLIDAETGTLIRDFEGEEQDLDAVAITPDGRIVAAAGGGADASVWDVDSGRRVTTMPFEEPVTALAFSPDGRWMLAGTKAGNLSLFELSGVGPAPRPSMPATILIVIVEPSNLVEGRGAGSDEVPRVSTPSMRVQGRVTTSAPLKSLFVDGREVTSLVPEASGEYLFNAYVALPNPGRHQIDIVAEDDQGTLAHRTFEVERTAATRPPVVGPGQRMALLVGISHYADPSIDLEYAGADAKALYDLLVNPALGAATFHPDNVRLLLDENATVSNINKGLRDFLRQTRENDFVLFFFAGHGAPDPNHLEDLYLLAHDSDPENIAGTGLLMRHVREAIGELPARDVLILADSCHSAGIAAPASMRSLAANPINQRFLEKMRHTSGGLAILTASEAAQVSFENAKWNGHGVFTNYLLKGLRGVADTDRDGIVTLGELMEFVRDGVRRETQSRQIPAIGPTSFDREFPLAIVTQFDGSTDSKSPRR